MLKIRAIFILTIYLADGGFYYRGVFWERSFLGSGIWQRSLSKMRGSPEGFAEHVEEDFEGQGHAADEPKEMGEAAGEANAGV